MPNDAFTQQALASDATFRSRVRSALSSVASTVIAEDAATENHENRINYAYQVVRGVDAEVNVLMPTLVMRPNVFSFETTHTFDFVTQTGRVVSAAGDPDIQSQLLSDWDENAAAAGYRVPPQTP